jgi:hypothetical protein
MFLIGMSGGASDEDVCESIGGSDGDVGGPDSDEDNYDCLGYGRWCTDVLVRMGTRRAMHEQSGEPRLPHATRRKQTFGMMLLLAASAGALLALGDVFQEQRKHVTQAA